jgi:hypothetical protein
MGNKRRACGFLEMLPPGLGTPQRHAEAATRTVFAPQSCEDGTIFASLRSTAATVAM